MTIIHGYLLGGLVLLGVPILVHLIMRQKPKTLQFPAFRFLKKRRQTNQRRLRLQHFVLLALRMLLIALLCLALAMMGSSEQANVLVFDSSPSMVYKLGGKTRIEDSQKGAMVLLSAPAQDSETAIFDTGNPSNTEADSALLNNPSLIVSRVEGVTARPQRETLFQQVQSAVKLLEHVGETSDHTPYLFVFSDFTRSSWEQVAGQQVKLPRKAKVVLVDVGVESPRNLAIEAITVKPAIAIPGERVQIEVSVRAVGGNFVSELKCEFEREPNPAFVPIPKQVSIGDGESRTYVFERTCPELPAKYPLEEMPVQVVANLATTDALPFDNSRFSTFLVRKPRKVLVVADNEKAALPWVAALDVMRDAHPAEAFQCTTVSPIEAEKLALEKMKEYKVVCLYQTANPPKALWLQLARFVEAGGGLVIVPGGEEMLAGLEEFNKAGEETKLLPAKFDRLITVPEGKPGVPWVEFRGGHPITAQFRQWVVTTNPDFAQPEYRPMANKYWAVVPLEADRDLATYDDAEKRPALLERELGKGKVIQLTLPLDGRPLDGDRSWHNYIKDSAFGLALIDQISRYLARGASSPRFDFPCGTRIDVRVPSPAPPLPYVLNGPRLSASESVVKAVDVDGKTPLSVLSLPQAVEPGNYSVLDANNEPFVGFSLNHPNRASDLERVSVEEMSAALGRPIVPVVPAGQEVPTGAVSVDNVKSKLEEEVILLVRRPVELTDFQEGSQAPWGEALPWFLMLLLLGLTVESFLANRFYRQPKQDSDES